MKIVHKSLNVSKSKIDTRSDGEADYELIFYGDMLRIDFSRLTLSG